ncbi:MFS transporter [Lichenicoccus sp.]|uniref:MFS transporter n=1 Tax=Lichenicoccus sp. TaxID=2781899 RepID=UPI003D0BAE49
MRAPLLTVSLGIALFAFNEFLVSTALPNAVRDIGGVALMSGAVSIYLLPSIASGVCAASLKRRVGTRALLLLAGLVFLAGTLVAAFAGSMPVLLAGRAMQGTGDGIIAALCYSLIPALFPPELISRVFGVEAIVWALAAFGGPLLSGWATQLISWRAAFLLNLPLIAGFLVLVPRVAPKAALSEPRSGGPRLRHSRRLLRIYWAVLLMPLAQAVSAVYLVLALQHLWDLRPGFAGGIASLMALSWSGSALLVAPFARWRQNLARFAPLLNVVGLSGLTIAIGAHWLILAVASQITVGVGFGLSWAPLSQNAMDAASETDREQATALLPMVQSAGYAIGATVAGLIVNEAGLPQALQAGHSIAPPLCVAYAAAALIALAGALPGLIREG